MHDYVSRIVKLNLHSTRTLQIVHLANADKLCQYRRLSEALLYPGQVMLPQACFVDSKLQQKFEFLNVRDLMTANEMVAKLQKFQSLMTFAQPDKHQNFHGYRNS